MNIGFFTDTYFPQINGVTYTIAPWKERLEEREHEVFIYYPKSSYTPKHSESAFTSIELRFYRGYRVALPITAIFKAKGLDIVHIHGLFFMATAGLCVSKRFNLPKVLTYHTPIDRYIGYYVTRRRGLNGGITKLYNFWERKLLNSCDVVLAPSEIIKERLLQKGIKRVRVLSHGIDMSFFKPRDPEKSRRRYGVKSKNVIGFCGRFGYEKHLEDLISLGDTFDGEILVVGDGPASSYYKGIGRDKKRVRFFDFLPQDELPEFYSALDLFIFPSTLETQGIVALEAMACGTPVIGANAMALRETIQDGKTGYLYEQGNTTELMEKVERGYENREVLSSNCLNCVKEHSMDSTIEKLLDIYNSLVG